MFPEPPLIDFTDRPTLPPTATACWQVLKTRTRKVITLPIGEWIARETIWLDPATDQVYPSASLRRLVAPGCNYGYDVVVYVGRTLFVEAQPVRQIITQLAQRHVHLSASTVADLGRRFIVLLSLAHRRCAGRLQQAMSLQGGYILHLDATYEDKSPMLMTVRKRLRTHGTVGRLRARLRTWQNQIDADSQLRQTLAQLPVSGWPTEPLAKAPLLAAYLLAHWILAGLQEGHGYGFPFDRPLLALTRRAQEVYAQLQSLIALCPSEDWRRNVPFHHLRQDLQECVNDRPLGHALNRLENHSQLFDQLRQALHLAPETGQQGLNHDGEVIEMNILQREVESFTEQVRARPDYSTTAALQKMLEQIEHYGPKLFAAPLVVSTPQGTRMIQPQRTNNLMERFFRDFKRRCRHKTGCQALGTTLRTMLADTPLVHNLQNPEYLKILLDGQPTLEALFAQIDPATVREELEKAQQDPERVPRVLKRFIASLPSPIPIKRFLQNLQPNRVS